MTNSKDREEKEEKEEKTKKEEKRKDVKTLFNSIVSQSNVLLLIWFLAIYFILYTIIGMFNGNTSTNPSFTTSRVLDVIIFGFLLFFLVVSYHSHSKEKKKASIEKWINDFRVYLDTTSSIFSLSLFLAAFYFVVYLFHIPMDSEAKPMTIKLVEGVAWFLFLIMLIVDVFKYFFDVSLVDYVFGKGKINLWDKIFDDDKDKHKKKDKTETPVEKNEVFNISNNMYNYEEAGAICSAFGAKLADYDQIEAAYNNGAEWCNYGWSKDQMAFFPTQKSTWNKLQQDDGHKNDCGRPGVNGGYMANPQIKFGVNCYGKKPKASKTELARMSANHGPHPKSKKDLDLEKKVKRWKKHADQNLVLNSFNKDKWSSY